MSQVLTVPTHFNDIGELSEGFLDRVEQDTLILYGPVAYEEGSEIEFAVLLADGSAALEGVGRVRAAVDGGEDRVPETRYDVVVEALQLDARSEVVFERLVIARQAVSDPPPAEDDAPVTNEMDAAPEDDEPVVEEVEVGAEDVYSLAPEEEDAPDTVPPEAYDDEEEDEPATVIAAVDAEAMMAQASADADADVATEPEPELETVSGEEFGYDVEEVAAQYESDYPAEAETAIAEIDAYADAGVDADMDAFANAVADAATDADADADAGTDPDADAGTDADTGPQMPQDSMYAFEHGIAAEPRVGMPVPIPSMAAPPEAPPAPPTLRLAEPPEGLTRPSLAQPEDPLFSTDGEVSDVHTNGLFAYEDGLPIPSRPPLPDPNRAKQVAQVEAANDYDVEDSEPPELISDDYEEVRLSDFAEAAEEG